jgi:hypothetical protein
MRTHPPGDSWPGRPTSLARAKGSIERSGSSVDARPAGQEAVREFGRYPLPASHAHRSRTRRVSRYTKRESTERRAARLLLHGRARVAPMDLREILKAGLGPWSPTAPRNSPQARLAARVVATPRSSAAAGREGACREGEFLAARGPVAPGNVPLLRKTASRRPSAPTRRRPRPVVAGLPRECRAGTGPSEMFASASVSGSTVEAMALHDRDVR